MKYALSLLAGGAALCAAALYWTLDIIVLESAILASAFGLTWMFLIAKKREAEQLFAAGDQPGDEDRHAA